MWQEYYGSTRIKYLPLDDGLLKYVIFAQTVAKAARVSGTIRGNFVHRICMGDRGRRKDTFLQLGGVSQSIDWFFPS